MGGMGIAKCQVKNQDCKKEWKMGEKVDIEVDLGEIKS